MTIEESHLIALPDSYHADYYERCAIDRGDGPLTDEIREQAFREVIQMASRAKSSQPTSPDRD